MPGRPQGDSSPGELFKNIFNELYLTYNLLQESINLTCCILVNKTIWQ